MSRGAIGITAAVAMLGTPAFAADMALKAPPPPAVFSWTGFYVGANVGYSWGNSSNTWNMFAANLGGSAICPPAGGALCVSGVDSNHLNGVLGGLQAGYNWQTANYLFGLEADIDATGQRRSQIFNGANPPFPLDGVGAAPMSAPYAEKLPWLGTFRGRVGIVSDHSLFYATGGLAVGKVQNSGSAIISGASTFTPGAPLCTSGNVPVTGTCPLANWSSSSVKGGWALGVGAEHVFAGNWSVKVEYLHVDLGRVSTSFATAPNCYGGAGGPCLVTNPGSGTISSRITDDIVRVGLNYRLNRP